MNDTIAAMPADRTAVSKNGKLIKVRAATMAGTIIEGFDFLAYGTAAALVFNHLYFPSDNPATATLAAFGAFAAGFCAPAWRHDLWSFWRSRRTQGDAFA